MNVSRLLHQFFLVSTFAVLANGCADDFDITPTQSDEIRFSASVGDSWSVSGRGGNEVSGYEVLPMVNKTTGDSMYIHSEIVDWAVNDSEATMGSRSNMVHSNSGMYDRFNVSAYHYDDDWTAEKVTHKPNFFYYEGAGGSMAGGYTLYTHRYWPTSGKMRFLAFAPYSDSNGGAYIMGDGDGGTGPYVYIGVDSDASTHQDLIVAYSEEIDCSGSRVPVNLNFKHALCCVQFVMADDMEQSRIKSISIRQARYQGIMQFSTNMADKDARSSADASLNNSYTPWDGNGWRDFTLNLADSDNPNGVEVNPGDVITDENHSFLMFPQIVPEGAEVEIVLSRKQNGVWGKDEVIFGYLSGKHWPAGKIVRYRVSKERWWQELQVSRLPAFPPQGGDQYFSITSFDTGSAGERVPVKWTVKYEDPNSPGSFIDAKPAWYDFDTANNGDVDPRSIKVTATALGVDHTIDLDSVVRTGSNGSTQANPYNLSTNSLGKTTIGTTANCYIVDRPGWYIIPLVYGNGVTGGSVNTTAYHPDNDTTNGALGNFVNCNGDDISSPYILTDCAPQAGSITAGSGKVVWQDKPNLIRTANITVDKTAFGGVGGMIFEVTAADIVQGNSVIGLELPGQEGKMMWSWHIWVTPFFRQGLDPVISETISITNHDGKDFNLMYVNLGWCSTKPVEVYSTRTSQVQFTATTDDGRTLTKTLTVTQGQFVKYWHGRNTYYQWGRKDPFQPFEKSWEQTWYMGDDTFMYQYPSYEKFGNQKDALKARILNPITFQISDEVPLPDDPDDAKPVNFKMYTNLWDATYSAVPVVNQYDPTAIEPVVVPSRDNVKSVYDPCPPGYKVPPIDTFTGFTNTGNDIGSLVDSPKNWNGELMQYDFDCGGGITEPYVYLFYTQSPNTSYLAMPLTGYRDWRLRGAYAGPAYEMGTDGYCWTAGAASDTEGYYLWVSKKSATQGLIMPLDYFWQTDAFPIRPCKE